MYIDHVNESTGIGTRFCLNSDHADSADVAGKLDCGNIGNKTTPVYFANGVPQTCEQIKTETLTINVNGENAGAFNGSQAVTIDIDTMSADDINALMGNYLPRSAGENYKLTGPLGLTNAMYGDKLPDSGFEGQLFFLAEDSTSTPIYVPEGGHTGEVLIKNSAVNGDVSWKEIVALPKGGSQGQILTKSSDTDGDAVWQNFPELNYLPLSGGTVTGNTTIRNVQILQDTAPNGTTPGQRNILFIHGSTYGNTADNIATAGKLSMGDPGPQIMFGTSTLNGGQRCALIYTDNDTIHKGNSLSLVSTETDCAFIAPKVYGAVWNDYAEYRAQIENIEPGYCVASADDGRVYKTTEKFQACDGIVSDTFGFAIGETDECKTPLAVAGRVLAYFHGNREDYHAGDTVCAGLEGKVMKMTREEIREWPDRIVGIVSEIPEYETWGSGDVPVNGRIWIKVR